MSREGMAIAWLGLGLLLTSAAAAEPVGEVRVGWDRASGPVLLGELNCTACHAAGKRLDWLPSKQSPLLGDVGGRVTPQYLQAFLSDPHRVKAGTPMPDLLHSRPEKERAATVEALVHYLVSLGGPVDQRESGASLTQIEWGKEVYHNVGCVACHPALVPPPRQKGDRLAVVEEDEKPKRLDSPSVPLGDLAGKTTVAALARFLDDPLRTRPSGRMPNLNLRPGEAGALAAYLLRDQLTEQEKAPGPGLDFGYYEGPWKRVPGFDGLTPMLEGAARGFDLGSVLRKGRTRKTQFAVRFQGLLEIAQEGRYRFWTKSDDGSVLRIGGKVVVDNDGIHGPREAEGQIELTRGRHAIEVGFINGGGGFELGVTWQPPGAAERGPIPGGVLLHAAAAMVPKGRIDFQVDPRKAERGRELFVSVGCAICHATSPDAPGGAGEKSRAADLALLDPTAAGGCLGEKVAVSRPLFALSPVQRQALRQTLAGLKQDSLPPEPRARIDHLMNALSCYACHSRAGKGGPDRERSRYFSYEVVVDLGDEGRLPPALNDVGAKLTPAGFEEMLVHGTRYRTYMATRMPRFGKANVGQLSELFSQADAKKVPRHEPAFSPRAVEDGRTLVGRKALACINCHAWGPHRLPGAEGMDLQQATRRLQPGWFQAWLIEPQRFRRGTRMPTAWPDGKSFFPDLQGGDMHRQIDAIWAYLSTGEKGGMPAGLMVDDTAMLTPTAEPIVFRTFLDQVSAHAILVGFKERTHVAFDANRVRMAVAWSGNFISTRAAWDGRAGQYAPIPSPSLVRFPEGPPFARLDTPAAAWPSDRPRNSLGSDRTPPGWRFLGYRFDDRGMPTFLYGFDRITVEESPAAEIRPNAACVVRRFRLTAKEETPNLYLRMAAGKKVEANDGTYTVDGRARYRLLAPADGKPQVRDVPGGQELLVPIRWIADGTQRKAELAVELAW